MAVSKQRSLRLPRRAAETQEDSEPPKQNTGNPAETFFSGGIALLSGLLGSFFSVLDNFKKDKGENIGNEVRRESATRLVQQLGTAPVDSQTGAPVYSLGSFPTCTEASDIRKPGRHFTIVTTAALPWRTGPAVNALMRALHLAQRGSPVTLVLPWIEPREQVKLFDGLAVFEDKKSQAHYIHNWCVTHAKIDLANLPLQLQWYEASYVEEVRSIFPKGDCSQELGDGPRDILILEEPEHLCWYHNGQRWPELFQHVIGVVHTNYRALIERLGYEGFLGNDAFRDSIFLSFTSLVCSAYCDVTVKLSGAGMSLPNEVTCNIHGVRDDFLNIGQHVQLSGVLPSEASGADATGSKSTPGAYFLGKATFQKGWKELLDYCQTLDDRGSDIRIQGFGSGPDSEAIRQMADQIRSRGGAHLEIFDGIDHADPQIHDFHVLVNPSTSEMLSTVTLEALAMRKRVVLPRHISNEFFEEKFGDRCHLFEPGYATSFRSAVRCAVAAGRPSPLTQEMQDLLSWPKAIDRLCRSAEVRVLSGSFSRPSAVASSRLAYDVHRRIQTETPSLSQFLKSATLKSPRTPWEEYMAQWRETEFGSILLKEFQCLDTAGSRKV